MVSDTGKITINRTTNPCQDKKHDETIERMKSLLFDKEMSDALIPFYWRCPIPAVSDEQTVSILYHTFLPGNFVSSSKS